MSKNLDTKIRETNDFEAWRIGLCQPSRPRPWSRRWSGVGKVRCHSRFCGDSSLRFGVGRYSVADQTLEGFLINGQIIAAVS